MANKHEEIKWQVISDWTKNKKGRLYCCNQGMATPLNGKNPIWFGPLKRNFKGFPDLFGFEYFLSPLLKNPIFTTVEVKTKAYPNLSKDQIRVMTGLVQDFGVNCYIAKEIESGYKIFLFVPDSRKKGYVLKEVNL